MTFDFKGKRGAWLNQYALPELQTFSERAAQVAYVILKYGFPQYERLAYNGKVPWLAEIYPYDNDPARYANLLADQAGQPGCVGAVVNMEYGSDHTVAHWDTDGGARTTLFINTFHDRSTLPLFASIDTRGNRPTMPYQKVLATRCEGVMPMIYPQEFGQSVDAAFQAAITPAMLAAWKGKLIIPTIQTYNNISVADVVRQTQLGNTFDGVTAYTIGHATAEEWNAFISELASEPTHFAGTDVASALASLRVKWLETMGQLALKGTPDEVAAFASYWKGLSK